VAIDDALLDDKSLICYSWAAFDGVFIREDVFEAGNSWLPLFCNRTSC